MLNSLKLENWKSHKESLFDFGKGTNILVGNIGSGKTTAMDAVCFALFGTYPALNTKRLSLDELIMRKPNPMDKAKVKLSFSYREEEYSVERTVFREKNKANEAKLYKGDRLVAGPQPGNVTAKVEEILQMNYHLFSRAVYAEQNQIDYFLRLSPRQRKEQFDELLELNKYETARANAVSLNNRLKKELEDRQRFLDEQQAKINLSDFEGLKKRLEAKEKEKDSLEREKEEGARRLESLEGQVKKLEKEGQEHTRLKEALIRQRSRQEEWQTAIQALEFETGQKLKELNKAWLEGEVKRLERELQAEALKKEKLGEKENALKLAEERLKMQQESRESLLRQLPEGIAGEKDAQARKAEVERKIEEKEKLVEGLKKERERLEAEINTFIQSLGLGKAKLEELEEASRQLGKGKGDCPVCKRPLEKHDREGLLKEHEGERKELLAQEKKIAKEEAEGKKKLDENARAIKAGERDWLALRREKESLEGLGKSLSQLEALEGKMRLHQRLKAEAEEEAKRLRQEFKPEKASAVESQLKKTERLRQGLELKEKILEALEEVKGLEEKVKELAFDEKLLLAQRSELARGHEKLNSLAGQIKANDELAKQIKSNLDSLEGTRRQLSQMKQEIEGQNALTEKLTVFINTLKLTQSQLRESLIDNINLAMDDIWSRLYPYQDYSSARIEIVDGNYEVKVKERNGQWVRVEGLLSGGERSAAALTLRVAISLVLTQNLSWIILDEPTHNLDSGTVKELSLMMREHLPGLVEQIFVITHDKEMEKAASASLYFLEREKDEDGVTSPVMRQVE